MCNYHQLITWFAARLWEVHWSGWALFFAAVWAGRIALKTLEAIREQGAISKDTLEIGYRANISIESVEIDDSWTVRYIRRNSGHLPADSIAGGVFGNMGPSAFLPTRETHDIGTNPYGDVIAPGERQQREFSLLYPREPGASPIISTKQLGEALSGLKKLQFAIALSYLDGFGHKRVSWRWFLYNSDTRRFDPFGARQD